LSILERRPGVPALPSAKGRYGQAVSWPRRDRRSTPAGFSGRRYMDIKTAFKTACGKAKLFGFRVHDIRHTAASWMIYDGIDIVTVRDILGHFDIKMTLKYCHSNKEKKQPAVDKLGTRFDFLLPSGAITATVANKRQFKTSATHSQAYA
jgi:integrase